MTRLPPGAGSSHRSRDNSWTPKYQDRTAPPHLFPTGDDQAPPRQVVADGDLPPRLAEVELATLARGARSLGIGRQTEGPVELQCGRGRGMDISRSAPSYHTQRVMPGARRSLLGGDEGAGASARIAEVGTTTRGASCDRERREPARRALTDRIGRTRQGDVVDDRLAATGIQWLGQLAEPNSGNLRSARKSSWISSRLLAWRVIRAQPRRVLSRSIP